MASPFNRAILGSLMLTFVLMTVVDLGQTAVAEITDVTVSNVEIRRSLNADDQSYLICNVCGLSPIRYLSATLQATNNYDDNNPASGRLPFVAIMEVRKVSDGTTVFLEFNMGTINGENPSEVGAAWQPKDAGQYELRVFAISSFEDPEILSSIQTFKYDIS